MAKCLIPKSIPIVVDPNIGFLEGSSLLLSTNIEMKYLPVVDFETVACFTSPSKVLLLWNFTFPYLGSCTVQASKSTFTAIGILNDW